MIPLFSKTSIATRVYSGFLLLTAIMLVHMYVLDRRALEASDGLERFRGVAAHNERVQDLHAQVVELQRNVQLYSYTGHQAIARRTPAQIGRLDRALAELALESTAAQESQLIARLEGHIAAYRDGFESALEERALRDLLVLERLPQLDARAEALSDSGNGVSTRAQAVLDATRLNMHRYLVDPDYTLLTETSAIIRKLKETQSVPKPLRELVLEYEALFTRMVQATRDYLFLVNVVLAGEATEFSYDVNSLVSMNHKRVEVLAQKTSEATVAGRRQGLWVSLVFAMFGVLFAISIGRSISKPIAAIAETLRRLAKGERGVVIPGVNRHDEVGTMAQAADVFREQNEKTATLLEETQQLAESLDAHQQELKRSNNELEQFVHTASHDLKAPLVTSAGFLGMARELAAAGEHEAAASKLDKIERAHKRMEQLLNDLLRLSRLGRAGRVRHRVSVATLVSELAEDLQLQHRQVTLEVGALPDVTANESALLQVFENLLGNAIKYAGPEATVRVDGERTDTVVRYRVSDNGPGVAEQHRELIFGLFQRLSNKTEGTGVGLAVVQRIMKSHSGSVWVESNGHGVGATFCLEFPIEKADERKAA